MEKITRGSNKLESVVGASFANWDKTILVPRGNSLEQDALDALVALGISRQQADTSIQKIILAEPDVSSLEELIKKALKAIWHNSTLTDLPDVAYKKKEVFSTTMLVSIGSFIVM